MLIPMPTPASTTTSSDHDVRVRRYVDELNDAVRRDLQRGERVLGAVIDHVPEVAPFVLLDEEPEPVLDCPEFRAVVASIPEVSTIQEQLAYLDEQHGMLRAA